MGFYEIKKGRKRETVQATSIQVVSQYCKNNNYNDWRMCGMMSTSELKEKKETCRVIG